MKRNFALAVVAIVAMSCATTASKEEVKESRVAVLSLEKDSIKVSDSLATIYLGGYGSSMAYDSKENCFYLMTDRGPNVDGANGESKIFPIVDFTPTIGKFVQKGDSLILVEKILLSDSNSNPLVGLPNSEGDGVTGEIAYDMNSNVLENKNRGIDSEGLTLAPDGTFWVSDEYAPFIKQFDKKGKLLREFAPGNGIPSYFAKRRPNRGMEGITISKDGKKLYGIMQSPLYIPDNSTKNSSINNRILEIDLESGATREFLYTLDSAKYMVSEISLLSDSTMLVLERCGKFGTEKGSNKKIYSINIAQATDISGKEVEKLSAAELEKAKIAPVSKELFFDILASIPNYPHDKPEGIAMINDSTLCIINDDDFSVVDSGDGKYKQKLNSFGKVDFGELYMVNIASRK